MHVAAQDRAGLERLLRYCARPTFALERLERLDDEHVIYRLPKPQRDGTMALVLTPLELIDHFAVLIPPPRRHRHRYHGVLAPNAPLRAAAIALGRDLTDAPSAPAEAAAPPSVPARSARSPARYLWAMLLARPFESLPLFCPTAGRTCILRVWFIGLSKRKSFQLSNRIVANVGDSGTKSRVSALGT